MRSKNNSIACSETAIGSITVELWFKVMKRSEFAHPPCWSYARAHSASRDPVRTTARYAGAPVSAEALKRQLELNPNVGLLDLEGENRWNATYVVSPCGFLFRPRSLRTRLRQRQGKRRATTATGTTRDSATFARLFLTWRRPSLLRNGMERRSIIPRVAIKPDHYERVIARSLPPPQPSRG